MAERKSTGPSRARYPRGAGWLPAAPKVLPAFDLMFEDIGAAPARLARHLGCDRTTIYRWLDGEPFERRAYQLAMFYETQWGRSFVATRAENDARLYGATMMWQRQVIERLERQLGQVGRIADFGSANDPSALVRARRIADAQLRDVQAEYEVALGVRRQA